MASCAAKGPVPPALARVYGPPPAQRWPPPTGEQVEPGLGDNRGGAILEKAHQGARQEHTALHAGPEIEALLGQV